MTRTPNPVGVLRRTVLKAGAVAAGTLAVGTPAAAGEEHGDGNGNGEENGERDDGEGFDVEILGEHAPFVDDVAATFELTFADSEDEEPIVVDMDDASSVIVAEATWTEGARSGWHQHPGMSIVHMVEGEVEFTMEDDCVSRTYEAGDAWIDPGAVHTADSEEGARAYVTFLGIPAGEPATEEIDPEDVEC